MLNVWTVGIGEPLVIDGPDVRLRRLGNLCNYITDDPNISLHYFSISFEHYNKYQRVNKDKTFQIKDNYQMHIVYVPGYKKNVSVERIITHKLSAKKIRNWMDSMKAPDIIYCGNTPLEMVQEVVDYGKKQNIPTIVDVRDLWPDIFRDAVSKNLKGLIEIYIAYCRKKMKRTYRNVTSFVGLSPAFLKYATTIAEREPTSKDEVIPIGYPDYDMEISKEQFEKIWGKYKLNESDFIIAFTGNFGRQYTFKSIVEAAQILKKNDRIKFVLCGVGEQFEKIKKVCPENVIFPGWIEKEMIISLLKYSNVGIAPYINSFNYRNNTPNKFGEYLAAGLPILVGVEGRMKEFLSDNNCGYYYADGEDLAKKIIKIYNSNCYEIMRKNARQLYADEFFIGTINQKLKSHICKIAMEYDQNV